MFKINGKPITVTIFPDKTSQVWKLPEEMFLMQVINIDWEFNHEGEVMHLVQLVDLFRSQGPRIINLNMGYLPYARQDKEISNNSTFALRSFVKVLNVLDLDLITILDPHSDVINQLRGKTKYRLISPYDYIEKATKISKSQVICYPDFSAAGRYYSYGDDNEVIINKKRDQKTGEILSTELNVKYLSVINDKKVLIVDDICDGGRTFINAAELLYEAGAKEVNLYVTHGIFSYGLKPLFDAKIKRIFTKNGEASEVQNNIVYTEY